MTGGTVSIFATVATTEPVLPARSLKSKVNDPLLENVFVSAPLLFVTVMGSLAPVRVATTGAYVAPVVEYITLAVGAVRSKTIRDPSVAPMIVAPVPAVRSV